MNTLNLNTQTHNDSIEPLHLISVRQSWIIIIFLLRPLASYWTSFAILIFFFFLNQNHSQPNEYLAVGSWQSWPTTTSNPWDSMRFKKKIHGFQSFLITTTHGQPVHWWGNKISKADNPAASQNQVLGNNESSDVLIIALKLFQNLNCLP